MKNIDSLFGYESSEKNTGFLLWQVVNLSHQKLKKHLNSEYNLSHSQYVVLASIFWLTNVEKKEVTQVDIAQYTKMVPMTVSQILKGLQKSKYIYRKKHTKDTRAKAAYLTEEGIDIITKALKSVYVIDYDFFQNLGKKIDSFNKKLLDLINKHA